MFPRAFGSTNAELVQALKRYTLRSPRVENTMLKVDRMDFSSSWDEAYMDRPHSIGGGQTISAPHMHVTAMQNLEHVLKPGSKVLDVGHGSGYLSACFAYMIEEKGKVVGIEVLDSLVTKSVANMKKNHKHLLDLGIVELKKGDGWQGDPENAPFDAIHVGAAAEKIPEALLDQLAPGGTMIIPVGSDFMKQSLVRIDKDEEGNIKTRSLMGVVYVPLVHSEADS